MEIKAVSSVQSSLSDIRAQIENEKKQLAEQQQSLSDTVNISTRGTALGRQTEISFDEASSLVGDVHQSVQDANSLDSVHSLDLARVLDLIS